MQIVQTAHAIIALFLSKDYESSGKGSPTLYLTGPNLGKSFSQLPIIWQVYKLVQFFIQPIQPFFYTLRQFRLSIPIEKGPLNLKASNFYHTQNFLAAIGMMMVNPTGSVHITFPTVQQSVGKARTYLAVGSHFTD